ncbi:MAG: RNA methyltransferase [Thiothrix sp.]|nr:RNA methyltransferase [Thiothrix sp.]HPQ94850.1 RNA methyltransferase [Thiolinea sp.]
MQHALEQLAIVMVHTSHPGNIGSAARAMKTMGLHDLRLVCPTRFNSPETRALASGADDILEQAQHFDTLPAALADRQRVIGTSARAERSLRWPQMNARQCGEFVVSQSPPQKTAIVFGRERTGLTNKELEYCQSLVHIPMAFDFFSLNIAAAIQIVCYECMMSARTQIPAEAGPAPDTRQEPAATTENLESFYQHLEQALIDVRYLDPDNPRLLMRRLRRLFGRTLLSQSEINILRGMLSAFQGRKFTSRSS